MTAARLLPRRDAPEAVDPIVQSILPRKDRRLIGPALAVAAALHAVLFFVSLPERAVVPPRPAATRPPLVFHPTVLRPPEINPQIPAERPPSKPRAWIPAESTVSDEPVAHEPTIAPVGAAPVSIEDIVPEPVAPAVPDGPVEAFTPGVTPPVLLPDCKVTPDYPELGRQARRDGAVVLRAVIDRGGFVRSTEVLSARPPGFGFEEAAIEAVEQWCYRPATFHGNPVDVYFTIYVTFELR